MSSNLFYLQTRPYIDEDFNWLWTLLQEAFPPEERNDKDSFKEQMDLDTVYGTIIEIVPLDPSKTDVTQIELPNNVELLDTSTTFPKKVGFFLAWKHNSFIFGEYLATDPGVRNSGIGGAFFSKFNKDMTIPLLFECELPSVSHIAKRRYNFYKRLGFHHYDINYVMPALNKGDKPMPLCLMGGGPLLSKEELIRTIPVIYKTVYANVIDFDQNQKLLKLAEKGDL